LLLGMPHARSTPTVQRKKVKKERMIYQGKKEGMNENNIYLILVAVFV